MSGLTAVLLMGFLLHSVHCEDFSVSLPQQLEAVRGSCLTIPCSFTVKDNFNEHLHSGCRAEWRDANNDQTVKFTRPTTGDLTQKNCTTTVYDITEQQGRGVRFRLDCDNPLRWTFKDKTLNIEVNEVPPTPKLTPPAVSVSEGQSVSVQCSAPVPCLSLPPTLTWSPVLGHIQETLQEQPDKTYVKVSTLNFTASHLHDKKNITCSAVYSKEDSSLSPTSVQIMSFVTYQPRNTSISPTGPVTEHSNMSLSCSSDANPAVQHYHWYKADGGTHTLMGNSSVLNMKASRDTTAIFCEAQNELGTDNSTITFLTIQYPPRNTTVTLTPAGPVTEHSNITLNCSSDANPSVFHWYKADGGTHTLIGNSSVLNTKASRDTTAIFCEVQNHLGTDRSVVKQLDVQFPPQIMSSSNCSGDSAQMSCVCETEGNPFPLIQWSFPGVSPNISISSEPLSDKALKSVITVIKPQWRDPVTLVCHSRNSLGSDTQSFELEHNSPEKLNGQEDMMTSLLITSVVILMVVVLALLCVIRTLTVRHNKHQSCPKTAEQLPENPENQDSGLYSSVNRMKKRINRGEQEAKDDAESTGSSYLEEQRSIVGENRQIIIGKEAECEYAQVKFKPKPKPNQ
ncbi:sialoadhesin-like [Periophthalmus magnuspinnatus]|uniref:sialoadhesin-like n=1 Tax=Periophthalmus magnuspinnatus TaxID=409849 RepID=UPI00243721B2|nr:sialoadhesin-like [Periophthalmus magnuspinnatus]